MLNTLSNIFERWHISKLEIFVITIVVLLTGGGIFASVENAIQLEQALNLNLTETLVVTHGIVNLQRDIQITNNEVLRLLGKLDTPPQPISHFVFVQIQVENLLAEAKDGDGHRLFDEENLAFVHQIEADAKVANQWIEKSETAKTEKERMAALSSLNLHLTEMELQVKQLIDIEDFLQRIAIKETSASLKISQITSIVTVVILLLVGIAMTFAFRRGLIARLNKAMEDDRLKSQLLTSVSHELRTPINAIQGYSQLLVEDAYGELIPEQKNTIRRIQLNTTQLQGMVNNLLDRAQLEQGKIAIRTAPFSPADFLETTHAALNILATSKGLQLTSEIEPNVPAQINGDVLRLQQILFNLTSNALKFTEKGSVHARIFLPDATHWALEVTDTGIGIAPEAQENIFAPFWQVDSSATRQYRGSGLGLSIVKQLSELMGGRIHLVSQPEKGSTFTIVFPLEMKA